MLNKIFARQQVIVKICGITTQDALRACVDARADMIGMVFVDRSARAIGVQSALDLRDQIPKDIASIGLFVDRALEDTARIVARLGFDAVQLHGAEDAQYMQDLRKLLPDVAIIKAIGVETMGDITQNVDRYRSADVLLFDAKPTKDDVLSGGLGRSFDWNLLAGLNLSKPWILGGGLDLHNVKQAVLQSGAKSVDVSSGVEISRGQKSPQLIGEFVKTARDGYLDADIGF